MNRQGWTWTVQDDEHDNERVILRLDITEPQDGWTVLGPASDITGHIESTILKEAAITAPGAIAYAVERMTAVADHELAQRRRFVHKRNVSTPNARPWGSLPKLRDDGTWTV